MRTKYATAATCVIALTLLAGCKSETKNETAATVDSTAAAAPMPAPAPAAPQPDNVTLASVGGSTVAATATATHATDSVTIVLNATGLEASKSYAAHIHTGDCAKGGPVAVPLTTIVAGADGTGSSTTVVALNKLSVDKPAFLQIHSPNKKPAACGDLPAHGEPNASTAMGAGAASTPAAPSP